MADTSKIRMNLAAITKVDPYATFIIDSSSHVAFYTFNAEKNEWEKTDVEGAFFIYNRSAQPHYSIFINNRLNTNSFVEPITNQLELQAQPPFLLYRNERSRIRGFWFYNSLECDRIGNLVKLLSHKVDPQLIVPEPIKEQINTKQPNNVNIFKLLSKAQQEYNSQTANSLSSAPSAVMKFFESARKPYEKSIYRALPATLSVEELEKQHISQANETWNSPQDQNDSTKSKRNSQFVGFFNTNENVSSYNTFLKPEADLIDLPKIQDIGDSTHFRNITTETSIGASESPPDNCKPSLMPPTMFDKPSKSALDITNYQTEPLNKVELIQALTYLIENDGDFVQKLHEAYLKSSMKNLLNTYQ